jgi:hypothetical protein
MGVDLGRRDIGMPQHRLQRAQIRAAFQQMRREGVAQHVRAHAIGRDPRLRRQRADQLIEPHAREMRLARGEQPRPPDRDMLAPRRHRRPRAVGDRHQPLAPALALEDQIGPVGMDRVARQRHQFGRAQPRSVEQLDQGREPQVERIGRHPRLPCRDHCEHRIDILGAQHLGQRPRRPRPRQRRARIVARASPSSARKAKNRRSAAALRATVDRASACHSPASRSISAAPASPSRPFQQFGGQPQIGAIGRDRIPAAPASARIISRKRSISA